MGVTKIRMVRWMCGYMRADRIRNVVISDKVGVTSIKDKIREVILKLFGYIRRIGIDARATRCERIVLPNYIRGGDMHGKSWNEVIKHDLNNLGLTKYKAHDRSMEV